MVLVIIERIFSFFLCVNSNKTPKKLIKCFDLIVFHLALLLSPGSHIYKRIHFNQLLIMYCRAFSIKLIRVQFLLFLFLSPLFIGKTFSKEVKAYFSDRSYQIHDKTIEADSVKSEVFRIFPLEYIDYDAIYDASNRKVKLKWTTLKERNNSHFEIERSVNNIENWETIGRVESEGTSDKPVTYFIIDENIPLSGGNIYYRLKQHHKTDIFFYSGIVSVKVSKISDTQNVIRAFPNPTNGEVRLEVLDRERLQGHEVRVRVINPMGEEGVYNSTDFNFISTEVSNFLQRSTRGIYILEVNWGKDSEWIKIIKN
jgi:hypothetical protein